MKTKIIIILSITLLVLSSLLLKSNLLYKLSGGKIINVLMYHHFDDTTNLGAVVAKDELKKQIKYLKDNGYNTITVQELINYKNGKIDLPENPVLITSDDGYLSNYEFMYPILKENNMKATIFVIGDNIDNADENNKNGIGVPKFNWTQAKEMYDSGVIDIQSHTYDCHKKGETIKGEKGIFSNPLKDESKEEYITRITEDMKKTIKTFEKNMGYAPIALAYPYGEYSRESENVVKENGIKVTFTVKSGKVTRKNKNTYLLKRVTVSGEDDINTFIKKLK